jgi:hypothetical protein
LLWESDVGGRSEHFELISTRTPKLLPLSLLKDKNAQLSLHLLSRTHLVLRLRERFLFLAMFMGEQLNHFDDPVPSNKGHEQSPLLL